jgi:hypothetical protein
MKSSEPGIITFYRLEVAKMRFKRGESVDTICRDMGITRHELQDWLEFDPRNYDEEDEVDDND